jgi:hypothetical protein
LARRDVDAEIADLFFSIGLAECHGEQAVGPSDKGARRHTGLRCEQLWDAERHAMVVRTRDP